MPSPYSLGADTQLPPDLAQMAQMGMRALQSGQVAPEDAMANLKKMGFSPFGIPGGKIGPETEGQSNAEDMINQKLAAQKANEAQDNQQQFNAQMGISMSPVAKGSGLTKREEGIQKFLDVDKDQRPQGLSDEEFQKRYGQVTGTPQYQRQEQGLNDVEGYLKGQLDKPTQLDLSPILATIDHWTGSKLAGAYARPESSSAQAKRIMDALQKTQKDRADLETGTTKGIYSGLTGSLGTTSTAMDQIKSFMQAADPSARRTPEDQAIARFVPQVQKDMAELKGSNAALNEADRLLASHTSISDNVFRDKFLKALIGGRVTNYDLMRQSGDTALADRAEQIFESAASGTFSPRNRAEYLDAVRVIREANAHEAQLRMHYWQDVGTKSFQISPERVAPVVDLGALGVGQAPSPAVLKHSAAKTKHAMDASDPTALVRVKGPDGKTYKMPASNLDKAKKQGYQVLP